MTPTEQQIEQILRTAPRPKAVTGLKERLTRQSRSAAMRAGARAAVTLRAPEGWLRRWWPALAPAAACAACAVALTAQQLEINDLKSAIQALSQNTSQAENVPAAPTGQAPEANPETEAFESEQRELDRLKDQANRLNAEVAQLEQVRTENTRLRTELSTPPVNALTPEEAEALAKARERAENIQCVNNLKLLALAALIWASDNDFIYPPDFLSMTNEMGSPKILICPADPGHKAAKDWASLGSDNCSYEYLAASGTDKEPSRVLLRCPFDGNIALCDGSVQSRVAKDHPEQLVERDGKLYFGDAQAPADKAMVAPPPNPRSP
jgi:FtsZ-binding cell division protein ZapB